MPCECVAAEVTEPGSDPVSDTSRVGSDRASPLRVQPHACLGARLFVGAVRCGVGVLLAYHSMGDWGQARTLRIATSRVGSGRTTPVLIQAHFVRAVGALLRVRVCGCVDRRRLSGSSRVRCSMRFWARPEPSMLYVTCGLWAHPSFVGSTRCARVW